MLTLISPAKKLLTEFNPYAHSTSQPIFLDKAWELARLMQSKSKQDISKLMDLSDALAQLNFERYQQFSYTKEPSPSCTHPALFLFQGDVYQGLQASTWNRKAVDYAQSHLIILSGLYGLLKPLDRIQAYRLEMGVHLNNSCGKNLYDFWGDVVTDELNKQLASQANPKVINLASGEYFKVVDLKRLNYPVITVNFYESKNNEIKMIGIHAKKARGKMAKFIMTNQIDSLEGLVTFNDSGYQFNEKSSTDKHIDFIRVH